MTLKKTLKLDSLFAINFRNLLFQIIINILNSKTAQKDCLASALKCQKKKMFKFHQFLDMRIWAQPVHFKNLQEDLGRLMES